MYKSVCFFSLAMLFCVAGIFAEQEAVKIELGARDFIMDALVGNFLGGKEASPDVDHFVRELLKEAGMSDWETVRIRRLSQKAIYGGMTQYNACAVHILGFPRYIYVSEEWFRELPEHVKRFLVGHEIMHLKYYHTTAQHVLMVSFAWMTKEYGFFKSAFVYSLVHSAVSKTCKWHADCQAAQQFNCAQGGVDLFKAMKEYQEECEAELPQWEALKWWRKKSIFAFLFASHPDLQTRINYLQNMIKE